MPRLVSFFSFLVTYIYFLVFPAQGSQREEFDHLFRSAGVGGGGGSGGVAGASRVYAGNAGNAGAGSDAGVSTDSVFGVSSEEVLHVY
jgi:hypothetical protein